jgi:hypothetical protein
MAGRILRRLWFQHASPHLPLAKPTFYNLRDGQIGFEPIPEPSTLALLGLSSAALAFLLRRR